MARVCQASALADGNYLFVQPLQRRVALALRQADGFQVEGPEVKGQIEPLQRQERGVAPVAGFRSNSSRTRTIIDSQEPRVSAMAPRCALSKQPYDGGRKPVDCPDAIRKSASVYLRAAALSQ